MRLTLKRAASTVATLAIVLGAAQVLTPNTALASGTLQGAATIKTPGGGANKAAGDSSTPGGDFALRLPAGAACEGDSANDGYRWQTYMVPSSVDPATLTFDASGPVPMDTGAAYRQPLYKPNGDPIVDQNTAPAITPPGPGPIVNIPDATFSVFGPGMVPTGVYNLGIACTFGPTSGTQMKSFWNAQMTVLKRASGGPAQFVWKAGNVQAAPDAPTISSLTVAPDTASSPKATVSYDIPEAVPALTGCSLAIGTTAGGSEGGTSSIPCSSTSQVVTGLTYGQTYFFRVSSTNSIGTATSNEVSGSAVRGAVTGLTATAGVQQVVLNWDDAPLLGSDTYNVAYCKAPATVPCSSSAAGYVNTANTGATSGGTITGLTGGTAYSFTVTYGPAGTSGAASATATPRNPVVKCNHGPVSKIVSDAGVEPVACVVQGLGL